MNKNMRKMYTEEQVKDVIQNAINDKIIKNIEPIYCHPLSIYIKGDEKLRVTCLIFNNDDTPFTWSSFKEWLKSISSTQSLVKIMVSGAYQSSGNIYIASYIASDGNDIYIVGCSNSDMSNVRTITNDVTESFEDGVNKIN